MREYFESICVAVILALFVRTFVVQAFKIPTGSMENNLLIGDHLLVNKFVFAPTLTALEQTLLPIDPIRRGDIIVFKYPEDPDARLHQARDRAAGRDDRAAQQEGLHQRQAARRAYVHFLYPPDDGGSGDAGLSTTATCGATSAPVTVPADQYFMMGDNRDNSQDSRYWGFLPRDYVKGKALFVYFSFGEGGLPTCGGRGCSIRFTDGGARQTASVATRAAGRARRRRPPTRSSVREMFESICVAVILAFFVRTFVVQAFKIPSGSMEPNLLIGDHLLVNKFVSAPTLWTLEKTLLPIDDIRRGDVIVFKHPKTPERDLIKRTIGLPGETIELRDKRVYVDGKPLDEPYAQYLLPAGLNDLTRR